MPPYIRVGKEILELHPQKRRLALGEPCHGEGHPAVAQENMSIDNRLQCKKKKKKNHGNRKQTGVVQSGDVFGMQIDAYLQAANYTSLLYQRTRR